MKMKVIAVFAALCIFVSGFSATVFANETSGQCGENVSWMFDANGILTISGNGTMDDYNVGKSPWASLGLEIKGVVIESGVLNIGHYAFHKQSKIESVVISKTVTKIGDLAFSGCSSLKEVSVPDSVRIIGKYAFSQCGSISSLELNEGIETIDNYAFYYCSTLKSVSVPASVKEIGIYAFSNCSALEELSLETGLKSIGSFAFSNCSSLKSFSIPEGVLSIGENILMKTPLYENKNNWEKDIFYLGEYLLKANNPISYTIDIKEGTTVIAERAFYNCSYVETVNVPNSVAAIGSGAFFRCENLEKINIPEGITQLGDNVFYNCGSLSEINFPASLKVIGTSAFYSCSSLKSVELSFGIEEIGHDAFYNCSSVTTVKIPDSIKKMSSSSFEKTAYYNDKSNWENGALYIGTVLVHAPENVQGYKIKEGTRVISTNAFFKYTSLEWVSIPESVVTIMGPAFEGCSELTYVKIPSSIEYLSSSAFYDCVSLETIDWRGTPEMIEGWCFMGCSSLQEIYIPSGVLRIGCYAYQDCTNVQSITLPNTLEHIERYAFANCSFNSFVAVPESVTVIEEYALGYYREEGENEYLPIEDFVICGARESEAERYARKNGFDFVVSLTTDEENEFFLDIESKTMPNVSEMTTAAEMLEVLSKQDGKFSVKDKDGNPLSPSDFVGTGCVVSDGKGNSYTVVICGDVDGTGVVDVTDYYTVKSAFAGQTHLDGVYFSAADADESGIVDATDYLRIKNYFLGFFDLYA